MPKRIQRKRTKGYRLPLNAVYVGRPTAFGNPFEVKRFGLDAALALYRDSVLGFWDSRKVPAGTSAEIAYQCFLEVAKQFRRAGWVCSHPSEVIRTALRGKDLACWCRLDQPCHADVLLELANAEPEVRHD